ncbi:UDP-N-acetylglucosamine transferase subunit ALG14 homolog [Asterias rubens]|uniref:UDP-N-acetylglucosamine transferase subunit ALG14 homolog n=1 Tax=Asterias rubens TaxID=7604 RepID=UPI00145541F3|nr:UDP-N-acetylglucosamine transferase subunit ALG14 homolog [Asterias rubens]
MDTKMLLFGGLCFLLVLLFLRLVVVLRGLGKQRCMTHSNLRQLKVMIITGSGGHTTEILRLMGSLSDAYSPRIYILADTDKLSEEKIKHFESGRKTEGRNSQFSLERIPRSREVRQSYITSVASTLYASLYSFPLVFRHSPDLILCNGPGTCIPICAAGFTMRFLGMKDVQQVYVESVCRVQTMSLSGRIMYLFADHLLVHWPSLKEKYSKSIYLGRVV